MILPRARTLGGTPRVGVNKTGHLIALKFGPHVRTLNILKQEKKFRFQLHRRFIGVLRRLTKFFNNLCRDLKFGV